MGSHVAGDKGYVEVVCEHHGEGGVGVPPYNSNLSLFHGATNRHTFFSNDNVLVEVPRDRIFARFFAAILGIITGDDSPNFRIFGHP